MTASEFVSRLEHVRKTGGGWMARCPAHDDQHASLSITDAGERILLHCHTGCSPESIVSTLGLTMADLFNKAKTNGAERISYVLKATHVYCNADDSPRYCVKKKVNPRNPKDKQYPQSPSDGNGGWITGPGCMDGVERILYRLPELLAADPNEIRFIPEGEICADDLRGLGLVATCNSGGAGKFGKGGGPDYCEP